MKSHIDDSVIACDEIIDTLETVWINSTYKMDCYIFHTFLLVIISLLKIFIEQKDILPFHNIKRQRIN